MLVFLISLIIFLFSFTPALAQNCLPGDANNDCIVDGIDYVVWLNNFNTSVTGPSFGDFDSNGFVDGIDYVIWLNNYGRIISVTPSITPSSQLGYQGIVANFNAIKSQTLFPVSGHSFEHLESTFGPRVRVSTGGYDFHAGIDIDAPLNTPVLALYNAELWDVVTFANGGLTVVLRHSFPNPVDYNGKSLQYFYTFHMHLNSVTASLQSAASQGLHPAVSKGMEIGKVGHTGNATGDHLHFELRVGSWCSLEFQLGSPSSSCSGFNFDPAMHSLFLFPPQTENPRLTLVTRASSNTDGKINYSSSPNAPILNRIVFKITDKASGTIVKTHTLDYNQRIGYDASTSVKLDTVDKTKPYISPVTFGVSKDPYETNIVIPSSFVGNFSGTAYNTTLTISNIWESPTTISW